MTICVENSQLAEIYRAFLAVALGGSIPLWLFGEMLEKAYCYTCTCQQRLDVRRIVQQVLSNLNRRTDVTKLSSHDASRDRWSHQFMSWAFCVGSRESRTHSQASADTWAVMLRKIN